MKLNSKIFSRMAMGMLFVVIVIVMFSCSPPADDDTGKGNGNGGGTVCTNPIFVSTSGNDANDGSSSAKAILTIQTAIDLAKANNCINVYVTAGTYVQGAGLLNSHTNNNYAGVNIQNIDNMNLLGGWNSDFSSQTGYSTLDGANGASSNKHIIWVQDSTNFTINGFVIINGNANTGNWPLNCGGGVFFTNVQFSLLTNCIVSNNTATICGGGVFLWYSDYNTISGNILYNTADYGGGIYLGGDNGTIYGFVYNNIASAGGGIYLNGVNNTISGSFYNNTATNGGGVKVGGDNNTISGSVYNNIVSQYGGGVFLDGGNYNTISGSVYNNTATNGGGVCLAGAISNTISGSILSNTATNGGGVYFLSNATNNTFTSLSVVRWNTVTGGAIGDGGGVYNGSGAGSQTTNVGFVISDNSPDNWADKP